MRDNRKRYHPDSFKSLSHLRHISEVASEENSDVAMLRSRLEEAQARLQPESSAPSEKLSLKAILEKSPDVPGYGGGKWAMYSAHCCWWTSFPEDLGQLPPVRYNSSTRQIEADPGGHRLPCCPHCGSVLMQAPLKDFIDHARQHPEHYRPGGLEVFAAAHSRNASFCARSWAEYEKVSK